MEKVSRGAFLRSHTLAAHLRQKSSTHTNICIGSLTINEHGSDASSIMYATLDSDYIVAKLFPVVNLILNRGRNPVEQTRDTPCSLQCRYAIYISK